MVINANGKNIDTMPFQNLFVQGEKLSEKIVFRIQRSYGDKDLFSCIFIIKGTNENNETAEQVLKVNDFESYLELEWNVSSLFTNVSGKLYLEIQALSIIDDEVSYVLKYILPVIYVKESLTGENIPTPDVQEQVISEINDVVADGLSKINTAIESFDISEVEKRLDSAEQSIDNLLSDIKIQALTLDEYNSTSHSENVVYIIV